MIRLDHHADPKASQHAKDQLVRALAEDWKTTSLEARYQVLYELAGASYDDLFIFTSSAAEAVGQVHYSVYQERAKREGKCHFLSCTIEGSSILQSLQRLETWGCFAKIVPIDSSGKIDLAALEKQISAKTALISISIADSLTGVIQPIEEIAEMAKTHGAWLHVDASSAMGLLYAPFQHADYLTFSGPSLHAVKGTGGLFVKKGRPLHPFILGGREQAGFRGGEFDIPSFLSLSAAASQALLSLDSGGIEMARLRDRLERGLQDVGASLLCSSFRLPNVTTMAFEGAHQEALLYLLHRKGVIATLGKGGSQPPLSHVLKEAGIPNEIAETAMSFAVCRFTTEEEIDLAIGKIKEAVQQLKAMSCGVLS